jgi:hypothetical protein
MAKTKKLRWVRVQGGKIPEDAVVGGHEAHGQKLYIIRSYYNPEASHHGTAPPNTWEFYKQNIKGWHPGKMNSNGQIQISFGGKAINLTECEVLVGKNAAWWKRDLSSQNATRTWHVFHRHHESALHSYIPWSEAQIAGHDVNGQPLYICRVHREDGSEHPGKTGPHLVDSQGQVVACYPYGDQEIQSREFDLLLFAERPERATKWILVPPGQTLAPGSVVGGHEADGTPLYVCRVRHREPDGSYSVHPGKFRPGLKGAHYAYGDQELCSESDYELLVEGYEGAPDHYKWIPEKDGAVPPNALKAGRDKDGQRLYVARFPLEKGGLQIGKVGPHLGMAHVSYDGIRFTSAVYEVLTKISH